MFLRLFLLAVFVFAGSAETDCSRKDSCFGEPQNCDPSSNCQSLIQFDDIGDLNLHPRNFTELTGYAAFPVKRYPDETIEYVLCVPYQQKYLRVRTEMDGFVLVTEEILNKSILLISQNVFQCHFDSIELFNNFHAEPVFTVSRGSLDQLTIINDGVDLHALNFDPDFEDDSEEIEVIPTLYFLGSPIQSESFGNGWRRSDRSPSNSDPKREGSQTIIEIEEDKKRVQVNDQIAERLPMSRPTTEESLEDQERTDDCEDESMESVSNSTEAQLIEEHNRRGRGGENKANSDTAKSVLAVIGVVTAFAMMRASTEEEIEADRQARANARYYESSGSSSPSSEESVSSSDPATPESSDNSSDSSLTSETDSDDERESSHDSESDDDANYIKTIAKDDEVNVGEKKDSQPINQTPNKRRADCDGHEETPNKRRAYSEDGHEEPSHKSVRRRL